MRKCHYFILVALFVLVALPSFGSCTFTTVSGQTSYYECIHNGFFYDLTNWDVYVGVNADTTHSSQFMCGTGWQYFVKSTGAYSLARIEQSFTAETRSNNEFDITLTVDLINSHNRSSNRLFVMVYNLTDNTSEVIDTIDGSGGDICSSTYRYTLSRSAWEGKDLKLTLSEQFYDSNAQINVSGVSLTQP
jgi:hypothetical protein